MLVITCAWEQAAAGMHADCARTALQAGRFALLERALCVRSQVLACAVVLVPSVHACMHTIYQHQPPCHVCARRAPHMQACTQPPPQRAFLYTFGVVLFLLAYSACRMPHKLCRRLSCKHAQSSHRSLHARVTVHDLATMKPMQYALCQHHERMSIGMACQGFMPSPVRAFARLRRACAHTKTTAR